MKTLLFPWKLSFLILNPFEVIQTRNMTLSLPLQTISITGAKIFILVKKRKKGKKGSFRLSPVNWKSFCFFTKYVLYFDNFTSEVFFNSGVKSVFLLNMLTISWSFLFSSWFFFHWTHYSSHLMCLFFFIKLKTRFSGIIVILQIFLKFRIIILLLLLV